MVLAALLALAPTQVLERAHAHNDYEHARPLLDALDRGFASVEADLFLVDGKLLVGHSRKELKASRTFESLYLKPLLNRAKQNSGWIYPRYYGTFWVLVDLKENGAAIYKTFKKSLDAIPDFKSVRFVISGDRPIADVLKDNGRRAGLDGRWPDLNKKISPTLMPWISEDWSSHFKWDGKGEMPPAERERMGSMVGAAHMKGYKLRFWGSPDVEAVWKAEWSAGVDWINTDRLDALRSFILKQKAP
jgi:hypothetical protein